MGYLGFFLLLQGMRVVERTFLLRTCLNQQLAGPREERETERGREKLSWQGDGACQTANGPGWRLLFF